MALAGSAAAALLHLPPRRRRHQSQPRTAAVRAEAPPSSSEAPSPKPFVYDRASPAVRWPNLDTSDYAPEPTPAPRFPPPDPDPDPGSVAFFFPADDDDPPLSDPGPFLPDQTRTRSKKMTKLALKRAKDWRRRVQFLADRVLTLGPGDPVGPLLDAKLVQTTPTDLCFLVKLVGAASWPRALEIFEHLSLHRRHSAGGPRLAAATIAVLGRHGQAALAEKIFSAAEKNKDLAAAPQLYNAMMAVHARAGRFDEARALVRAMRDRGCEPDLVTFNTLLHARARSGRVQPGSALGLLRDLRRAGLRPDTVSYNTLISACSGPDEAARVFDDMAGSGCEPDLWTYNAMIAAHGRAGRPAAARRLLAELQRKGFSPDAVTFNSLVHAFARAGDSAAAEELCAEMARAGFARDEVTYNTMIHMYGKKGEPGSALALYREMDRGPDPVTLTVLVDALGRSGRIEEAGKVVQEAMARGVRPGLRAFCALVCGFAKAGLWAEAQRAFGLLRESGVALDGLAYNVGLEVSLRMGDLGKTMAVYRDMVRDGFSPDKTLYRGLLLALGKAGKDDKVGELAADMEKVMDLGSVSLILVRAQCFELGLEVLKRAVARGDEVDEESLVSILNAYGSEKRDDEARVLIDLIKDRCPSSRGFLRQANIIMLCKEERLKEALLEYDYDRGNFKVQAFEALILCCEKKGALSESCQLFSDMGFVGIKPSKIIFRSMISAYCELGFPETAQHVLDRAESFGLFLTGDISPYLMLIESLGKLKLWEKAEGLVGCLRNRFQAKLDRKVWNALIHAYAESGLYEKARAIFNIMIRDGHSPSVDSINGLMQALIVDGRLEELYVVIQELQDMDFKISKSTILLMLEAFAKAGNIFEVKKIYHGMKAAGYLPTLHLYRTMVCLLARSKRVRDVELMISEMETAGFKPDLSIFNSILKMYLNIEDFRKTEEVYKKLLNEGFQPDEDTYSVLISAYCKENRPEEGLYLMGEMISHGLHPKLGTYKSLLAAFGRAKLWEQAESLFDKIRSTGQKLDRSVYHVMLKIHRDSGNHSKAEHVLSLMKEAGVEPTISTMHMLMVSYGDARKPKEAEMVLNNLRDSGLGIGTLPYMSVIDAYLKNGDYDLGIKKMQEMQIHGIEPDHKIWTCFIRAASLCSETDQGMVLLSALRDVGVDLPMRLLTAKAETLVVELDSFLDRLGFEEDASFNFVNALEDLLWAFERRATASWIFQLAIKKGIYRRNVFRVAEKDWGADFRKLSPGAALIALTLWLDDMQDASLQGTPESPKSVVLITGTSRYNMVSLNDTLKTYLWEMGSPFLPCKTRTGLLVAKAHSLRMWLKDSSFCTDLELKDAPSLPKSNSIQLVDGCFMRAGLVPAFKEIFERMGQVRPKKFARLALMSDEKRDKAITADINGRMEKLEKMKRKEVDVRSRRPTRLSDGKFMRRRHRTHTESTSQ